jgi:hypothetical protein
MDGELMREEGKERKEKNLRVRVGSRVTAMPCGWLRAPFLKTLTHIFLLCKPQNHPTKTSAHPENHQIQASLSSISSSTLG